MRNPEAIMPPVELPPGWRRDRDGGAVIDAHNWLKSHEDDGPQYPVVTHSPAEHPAQTEDPSLR